MKVKELKELLEKCDDEQKIVLKKSKDVEAARWPVGKLIIDVADDVVELLAD